MGKSKENGRGKVKSVSFKAKRRSMLGMVRTRSRDTLCRYPIMNRELLPLLVRPQRLILCHNFYLENLKQTVNTEQQSKSLPFHIFREASTCDFVRDAILPRVDRFTSAPHLAFLLQAVFDNYEWRAFVFYMVTIKQLDASTKISVSDEQTLTVEKRSPLTSGLFILLGSHLGDMAHMLKMTYNKKLPDLKSVCNAKLTVSIHENEFIVAISTSMPPVENPVETRERYQKMLSNDIKLSNFD